MTRHLGLDLGGSAIKAVVLERNGDSHREVRRVRVATRTRDTPAAILAQLAEVGRELMRDAGGVDTAGATIPGTFDLATGVARFVPNLGSDPWEGVAVRDLLEDGLGMRTALLNDARAFGFAESQLGAARGCGTAAFFTLGTGVGGAIVVGGVLQLGAGSAGELGHITVDARADAPPCGCGNRGCVEAHVQAAALARAAGRESAEAVIAAARAGDARALAALGDGGRWLGVAISAAIVVLNPDRVVVGGGVAEAGELILEPARAEVRRRVRFAPANRAEIVGAALGYEAGSIGAALWGAERP